MRILKKMGKGIGKFLFTIFIATWVLTMIAVRVTEYTTLEPLVVNTISRQYSVDEETLQQMYFALTILCEDRQTAEIPLGDYNMSLDCATIRGIDPDELGDVFASKLFGMVYYAEYDCEFIDCLTSGQIMVIVSAKGNRAFKLAQNMSMVGTVLAAVIVLVLSEGWPDRLKSVGTPLIVIGLPAFVMSFIEDLVTEKLITQTNLPTVLEGVDLSPLMSEVFFPLQTMLLTIFVAGLALTACGYIIEWYEKRRALPIPKKKVPAKKHRPPKKPPEKPLKKPEKPKKTKTPKKK